jgi:hypothetical protein
LGLLHGTAYYLSNEAHGLIWTKDEEAILERVRNIAPELWADYLEQHTDETETDTINSIMHFEPRLDVYQQANEHMPPLDTNNVATMKAVDLRMKTKIDLKPKSTKIKKVE